MKTICVNGVVYHCPLSARFRRHTDAEREAMRETAAAGGIEYAVKLYYDTTLNLPNCILDGEGRAEIALSCGVRLPTVHVGELTTEQAYTRALGMNDARRHEDPEAIRQRRRERIERVAEKRREGKSIRTIAEEEEVSKSQIERDLEEAKSTVPPGTVEPESGTVIGKDGKERPATMPKDDDIGETGDLFGTEPGDDPQPVTRGEFPSDDEGAGERVEPLPKPFHQAHRPVKKGKAPPPKRVYPEPYASLLDALTDLSGKFTRFINSAESERFREYIAKAKLRWVDYRTKIVNGRKTNPQWAALRAIRRLLREAYRDRNLSPKQITVALEECGGDLVAWGKASPGEMPWAEAKKLVRNLPPEEVELEFESEADAEEEAHVPE